MGAPWGRPSDTAWTSRTSSHRSSRQSFAVKSTKDATSAKAARPAALALMRSGLWWPILEVNVELNINRMLSDQHN